MPSVPRPGTLPEWATDVGADITDPPAAQKSSGWLDLQKPPHDYFNWWQNLTYDWLEYLDDRTLVQPKVFDLLEEAYEDINDDEIAIINEWNPLLSGDSSSWTETIAATTSSIYGITCDGEAIFISYEIDGQDKVSRYARDGTEEWTEDIANPVLTIFSDGDALWYSIGGLLYKRDRSDGSVYGTWTPVPLPATIESIYSTGAVIWIGGGSGATATVRVYQASDGTQLQSWSLANYSDEVRIQARGGIAWVAMDPTLGNDSLFRLDIASGTPTDSDNLVNPQIKLLDDALFVSFAPGAWQIRSLMSLTLLDNGTLESTSIMKTMAYDGEYLYTVQDDIVWYYRADRVWCITNKSKLSTDTYIIDADASAYFILSLNSVTDDVKLSKWRSPKRSVAVRKCLGTDGYRSPFSQLMVPVLRG